MQLAGTLLFNDVNTGLAMVEGLSARAEDLLVWAPDMVGSACFLAASWVAWAEACGGRVRLRPGRAIEWWICGINMAGSVAFGVSALAAFVMPATGGEVNAWLATSGTLAGAVCFLAAALLLLPESVGEAPEASGLASPAPARGQSAA